MYPHFTETELAETEVNLDRYLALALRIFERMETEPNEEADQLTPGNGTLPCPRTSIREEAADAEVALLFQRLRFHNKEKEYFKSRILTMRVEWASQREDEIRGMNLQVGQIKDRLNRLTERKMQTLEAILVKQFNKLANKK